MTEKKRLQEPEEIINLSELSSMIVMNIQRDILINGISEVYLKDIFRIRKKYKGKIQSENTKGKYRVF